MNATAVHGRHWAPVSEDGSAPEPPLPEPGAKPALLPRLAQAPLRPTSIRAKLTRILLVSLLLVLVVLAFMVSGRLTAYRAAVSSSRVVTVTLSVQDLVHSLQKERGLTNGLLSGGQYYRPSVTAQRIQSDASLAALRAIINDPTYAGEPVNQVRAVLGKLDDLDAVRREVDSGQQLDQTRNTAVFNFYAQATRALNSLDVGLEQARDTQLRRGFQALYALGDAKDYADWERGLLNGVFSAGGFQPGQYEQLVEIRAHRELALADYYRAATPEQRAAVQTVLRSPVATRSADYESIALNSAGGTLTEHVDPQNHWWNQMTLVINDLRTVQQQVGADITNRADELQADELHQLIAYLTVAALAMVVEVMLVIGASRSIIDPLGTLAAQADDVAANRLPEVIAALENSSDDEVRIPEPVPLSIPRTAGTEIRRVAASLSRLQATALSLAGQQAMVRRNTTVSLANLGRRNQNLVRRQLGLITEFEREELDPDMLANMFELDHLATRMRRNAESLLVLVGESGPKPWSAPLAIVDVVRASLSEVEDYRRVALKRLDEVYIAGSAVTEVAHILAELLENGLAFSPADVEVEVHGRQVGNRYTLAVVDHGTGMQPDQLVKANTRLHDEENYLVAPTRFLGHYVVGRLSRQLGIEVSLAPAPITGVTARLVLPPELLTTSLADPKAEAAMRPAPASERPSAAATARRPVPDREGEPALDADQLPPRRPGHALTHSADTAALPVVSGAGSSGAGLPSGGRPSGPNSEPGSLEPAPLQNQRVRVDVRGERERTRNGLLKRRTPTVSSSRAQARPARPAPSHPVRQRTPSDIGEMLSSYRAGHRRGELGAGPADPQPMPQPRQRPTHQPRQPPTQQSRPGDEPS